MYIFTTKKSNLRYCQLVNEIICTDYTSKVDEKQFLDMWKGQSPESPRSKFTVVGLWY